jgi:hypothetical protein
MLGESWIVDKKGSIIQKRIMKMFLHIFFLRIENVF